MIGGRGTIDSGDDHDRDADKTGPRGGTIPSPSGIYVLNDPSNEQSTSTAYAARLETSEAYVNDVTGHAVFVPIAKILPSITTWGQFNWSWVRRVETAGE